MYNSEKINFIILYEVRRENIILYDDVENIVKTKEINKSILEMKEYLKKIESNRNILIVGSGGSYVTGLYTKNIIENNMKNLCDVLKPMEVLQSNLDLYSYVIIYSYRMNNYDIKKAINHILNKNNIIKILIITAKKTDTQYNDNRISYIYYDEKSEYEKKYVSYKGIYLPTFILGSCFENIKINFEKLKNINIEINHTKILDIFYDKDNYCLAQLLERHLCELGICTVRIHEKKDFSHGRMGILTKGGEIIFINSYNYDIQYDNMLFDYLKKIYNSKVLNESELNLNIQLNYFEKILVALFWINKCSIEHKISLEGKKDTKDDEKLFKYGEERIYK